MKYELNYFIIKFKKIYLKNFKKMNDFQNNIPNSLNKKILINNNYYKEDKNLGIHRNNNYLAIGNNKTKGHSSSKNKYKVTYINSIWEQNLDNNQNKNIENKNVYNIININNKNTNSSIGNIKEINFYNNGYKNQTNTSYNFYDKIVGKIILNNNSIDNNRKIGRIKDIKTDHITNGLLNRNNNKNNIIYTNEKSKSRSKKFKNRKKGPKSIYANKRPSMPLNKNKKKNNLNNLNLNIKNLNTIKNAEMEIKSHSNKKQFNTLTKLSFSKNKNHLVKINSSNNYNTYNDNSAKKNDKNNLIPICNKHKILSIKKPFKQEIKKCQSQSYFKKYKFNNDVNTSYSKMNQSKSKNKNNNLDYKGIILNKKNLIHNNINYTKNSLNNSGSKKNRILCVNYNKSSKKKNIIDNNNFLHFMNNLPEEFNKNSQFSEIKKLWNKLKVTNIYQEMFISLTIHYNQKKFIFNHELQNLKTINNLLLKINSDIKKRNGIIDKIKLFNNNNNNTNTPKNLEEMKKDLNFLRNITIDIILDYISFFKEISYDLLRNKYDLNSIKNFDKDYLNKIKEDTTFLYYNNYLNKHFNFSHKSDPFLINPSINKTGFIQLPIDDDTLQKISQCRYFLLTEKISIYSLSDDISNIQDLLFNDNDNIINNLINSSNFNQKNNNDDIINNINTEIKDNNNISIFNQKIDTENNLTKTEENENKYNKFCYVKTENNSNNQNKVDIIDEKYLSDKNNNEINKSDKNTENEKTNSILNNSDGYHSSTEKPKIKKNILTNENNNNIIINNINNISTNKSTELIVMPYISSKEIPLVELYKNYLSSIPDNIKDSFDINKDIFYYSNIGLYPKIILFKDNTENNNLIGLCTISYNPSINPSLNFSKKILMITSISCKKEEKISNILKSLINFCDKNEIIYDSMEVDLHYIKKEDCSYFLDKEMENEIKSETKFKWVRLENNGEKRKIKYHYLNNNIITDKENSIGNNKNENMNYINSIYMNNYVLIKFLEETGINGITSLEYSKLYFIISLLKKYYLLDKSENISQEIEGISANLKGLKLKKLVRILSEYCNPTETNSINFKDDYCMNDNYNIEYLNNLMDIIEKDKDKNNENDNICLNFISIISNFSNIIKTEIDNYEYNIISMENYIIEVFNMNDNVDDNNKQDFMYFTKSEIENISFIFYEINNEDNFSQDENDIKPIFNKILKKILVKDSEEPIKSYKKICIPSFKYRKEIIEENNDNDFNLIKNKVLGEEENMEFCLENNINNDIKFSFNVGLNKNLEENNEIKIIKNNFVLAVLNPDLVLDFHLPCMNIFYIDKSLWKKIDNNNNL